MATLSHSESRRRYSWWWNSHISPKNSKWLQENLTDMDTKVKAMIKLIEEDADSFARRAEMYYKKRPELMKLVEEFYRAYRALAERYDSATGALRQAHRTMAEAFPNQIPLMLPDESAYGSINYDVEPNTPETPPPGHPGQAFDADGLKDTSSLPSDFQIFNKKGTYSKEAGSITSNMGLKQSNEIFTIAEGRARKGADFSEEEGEGYPNKASKGSRGFPMVKEKQNRGNAIKGLQQDISRLSTENQNLRSQIMEASDRVSEAENEVQTLKDTLAKINSQKDSEERKHQLSLEKISSLESQLSNTQNGIQKLNDELVNEAHKLFSAEELIQSLRLELDLLEKKAKMQEHELKAKHDELNELNVILQDKNQQCIQAEISLLSKEKLLIESQQELELLNVEIKNQIEKLRDVELCKEKLEEEMHKLMGENNNLKEENLQHDLTIKGLQDEINLLKDKRSKLEEEVEVHAREKESLVQELNLLQGDRSHLERKVKDLLDELEVATVASDNLQASIKKLESEKIELKDNCNKMEAQNVFLMDKIKDMDKISEENRILENSLSNGNAEIEVLREKIAELNHSHESLNHEISTLVAEKDSLVSQLDIITQNVENLSAKNASLENELSNANNEVGSLKAKLKDFEDSCQFLNNQNSLLHTEKLTLISEVESITHNLENLANELAEHQDKYSSLSREKDLSISQISELQILLKLEKQEQESVIESYKVKFAELENKISFLQEENLFMENELEAEQDNFVSSMIENFLLQTSLSELYERNTCLSLEGRKHLEAQERAETLVKQLEKEKLIQLENISSLSRHNEKLNEKIHLLSSKLLADEQLTSLDGIQYEVLLDSAIAEVTKLMSFISDIECENQKMHLQLSVLVTFLRQIVLDVINLRTQKFSLENELDIKAKEILLVETKQVEQKHREEILQLEMEVLSRHLSNLQEAVQMTKKENVKLMEENKTLSEGLYNLKQKHNELEEEKIEVCLEAMNLDYLCCFFKCLSAEKLSELKCFSKELASLRSINNCRETEINRLNGEITVVKSENTQLMKLIAHLEEQHKNSLLHLEFDLNTTRSFFEELDLQLQNIKVQLSEKEAQLLEANKKVEFTQGEKAAIQILLQALQMENKEAMQAKEELEKTISVLSEVVANKNNETRSLHESGETLQKEIDRLHIREKILISELEKQTNEVDISAGKIAALLTDVQILKDNAATCEEKVQDIIVEGEIHSMVEKQILTMELTLTNNYVAILKSELDGLVEQNRALMNDIGTYPPKITSLWKAIACLEEEVMSIANPKPLENQNIMEDIRSVPNQHSGNQPNEDHLDRNSEVLELEKLIAKVEALQKTTSEARAILNEEKFDSSCRLDAACKEIEELKMNALLRQPEIHGSSDSISNLADDRGVDDDKMSKDKYGQVVKDIPLDEASSPLPRMNIRQGGQNVEFDDQLWETAERNSENKTWKVSPVAVDHDMEIVEEEKSEFPHCELAPEKEFNIDKPDMMDGTLISQNDWNERVLQELTSDAVRLSGIMSDVEVMKRKMESLQVQELPPNFGYNTIKAQLKEAEGAVLRLIEFNSNLTRKAQEHDTQPDGGDSKGRRIISEQARRASDKVVRLEFELQKIQYVLLKLEEEYENRRAKAAQRRTRVMLRDYLYGRKDNHRKQSRFCGCMRPKTTDDHQFS